MSAETRREADVSAPAAVRLFSFVLSYDEPLAGAACSVRLTGALAIERGEGELVAHEPGRITVRDPWLSGKHARIEQSGERDVLVDLGSSNGTRVNGRTVTRHELVNGDLVEAGHSLFVYRVVDARRAARVAADGAPTPFGPTGTLSPEMLELREGLLRVARSLEPVLLLGETGTGKEVLAAFLHAESGRTGALRAVDCGAVPETLFESTFFGHRKGAFTGAAEARTGELMLADEGSLFLDEIGNLAPSAQAKLLRALETRLVTPLGASDAQQVDVRFVAATNRELFQDGGFRADLLRRLSGYVARLPPLRERCEDLGLLCAHFLREAGRTRASFTPAAARALFMGSLPGNVRELRSTLRSAALLAGDEAIDVAHLPRVAPASEALVDPAALDTRTKAPNEAAVRAALTQFHGNVVQAARELGVHPRQLYRLIARFAIDVDGFRE